MNAAENNAPKDYYNEKKHIYIIGNHICGFCSRSQGDLIQNIEKHERNPARQTIYLQDMASITPCLSYLTNLIKVRAQEDPKYAEEVFNKEFPTDLPIRRAYLLTTISANYFSSHNHKKATELAMKALDEAPNTVPPMRILLDSRCHENNIAASLYWYYKLSDLGVAFETNVKEIIEARFRFETQENYDQVIKEHIEELKNMYTTIIQYENEGLYEPIEPIEPTGSTIKGAKKLS